MAIKAISLEINQHDDKRFYFDLTDQDGNALGVDQFTDLFFSIAPNVTSTSIMFLTLQTGEIVQSGPSQVYVDMSSVDSGELQPGSKYIEFRGLSTAGAYQTMGAGSLSIVDTQIGDYN